MDAVLEPTTQKVLDTKKMLDVAQSEINIAIGDKAPKVYFKELAEQCAGGLHGMAA